MMLCAWLDTTSWHWLPLRGGYVLDTVLLTDVRWLCFGLQVDFKRKRA